MSLDHREFINPSEWIPTYYALPDIQKISDNVVLVWRKSQEIIEDKGESK